MAPKAGSAFVTKDSGQREDFDTGARRDVRMGKGRYDLLPVAAIRRLAELMERGAVKYGERNFEKGMPFSRYLDSAARHLFQALDGQTDEDHLAAVLFNIASVMHHQDKIEKKQLPADLDDVFHTKPTKKEREEIS